MSDRYVEYKPVVREGDSLVYVKMVQFPDHFQERITNVFDFYQVSYRVKTNGRLLVRENLLKDKELIWNYTSKALDDSWIETNLKGAQDH